MSSNIKPKTPAKEAPTEPFKRAVTSCLRAIARHPDVEVAFAAERPGLVGGKARLPEPPRRLSREDAAIVRGHADSIALRLACHDAAVHRKLMPGGQQARAVFEAVALIVRERLTGHTPPPAAKRLVDLWRPFVEERAGRELDRLERLVENQRRFGDVVHDLLDSLDMGDERARDDEESEDDEGENGSEDQQGQDGEAAESDDAERMSAEDAKASAEDRPDTAEEAMDAPATMRTRRSPGGRVTTA